MNKKSGIYCIKNIINQKLYIGKSNNLLKRKNQHFRQLALNAHFNQHLQNAYNKYGCNNFEFTVIEYIEPQNLLAREQYYIDLYGVKNLYNISPIAGQGTCDESVLKTKITMNRKYSTHPLSKGVVKVNLKTNEIIKKYKSIKEAALELETNPSERRIKDIIGKISEVCKGKRGSAFNFKWNYINHCDNEFKYKKINVRVHQLDALTNEIINTFTSINEAARQLGLKPQGISNVCAGLSKTSGGFKWSYSDNDVSHLKKPVHMKFMKAVNQISKDTNEIIRTFISCKEASKITNTNAGHISAVCLGKRKTAGGYKWQYA